MLGIELYIGQSNLLQSDFCQLRNFSYGSWKSYKGVIECNARVLWTKQAIFTTKPFWLFNNIAMDFLKTQHIKRNFVDVGLYYFHILIMELITLRI